MLQGRVWLDFSCFPVAHGPLRWLLGSPTISECGTGVKRSQRSEQREPQAMKSTLQ